MEVHHHPDLHHNKKKWKEYLLECLMIFLAVTLGFFAETIREKVTEKHREKEYIVGLINNMQNDTSNLKGIINRIDLDLRGLDSLIRISKENFTGKPVQDSIYYYSLEHTFNLHLFQFNDLTLVQLRNAGGYSLIRTATVADSIALYESKNNNIKIQERFYIDAYIQTQAAFKQVFDCTLQGKFTNAYRTVNRIPADINVLISKDAEKMHVLYNDYWTLSLVLAEYNNKLKAHVEYLNGAMAFLKQTYQIE